MTDLNPSALASSRASRLAPKSSLWLTLLTPQRFLSRSAGWRYGMAAVLVMVATLLRRALIPWMGTTAHYDLDVVVAIAATMLFGIGPGLLSVVLGDLALEVFVKGSLPALSEGIPLLRVGLSLVVGGLAVWLVHAVGAAQAKSRMIEERLEVFATQTFEGLAETEAGRILDCNGRFAQIVGRTVEELKGMPLVDLVAPENRERATAIIDGNDESLIELDLVRRDGTRVIAEVCGRSVAPTPGTEENRAAIFVRDISERRLAEAEIKRIAGQRQLALDAARLGWWHYNPVSRLATWDDRYREIFGVAGHQLPNDEILATVVHPEDLGGLRDKIEAALDPRNPRPFAAEYRINRPDGVTRWIEAHGIVSFEGVEGSRRAVSLVGTAADITEHKEAERAVRQSQEDLARAQEVGQIGWWRLDTLRDVLEWSDQSHQIFGVPKGTPLTYEAFLTVVHPDDREYVDTKWQAGLKGEPYDIEHRIVVGGRVKWVREKAYLERDAAGKVLGGFGIAQDITDRRLATEALRESEARLRHAQASAGAGIWTWDLSTGTMEWSDELFRLFGLDPSKTDATLDSWSRVLHPEDRQAAEKRVELAIAHRSPLSFVYRIVLPSGEVRWVNVLGNTASDDAGRPLRMSGICIDVTERQRAEEQLRTTLESIGDGFLACDGEWRFVYVNAPAERMLGIRREEVLGKSHWEVFPLTLGTDLEREYSRAAAGEARDFEHFYEPWGRWFHNRCFPREGGGMSVYFSDITERKRVERALRLSEEQRKVAEAVRAERQRFFDVLETLPVYVALLTPDHHVPFANRFFRERFGEARGRRCYEYLFNRQTPCEICESFTVFETKAAHRWDWVGPDRRDYEIYDFPFTDADGSPLVLEMGVDVTDRKRAEKELQTALEDSAARAMQLRALASELTRSEQRERKRLAKILHDHLQQLLIAAKYRTSSLGRSRDQATRQAAADIERLLDVSISASRSLTAELSPPILHEGQLPAALEWLARWMADRYGLIVDLTIEEAIPPLAEDVKILLFESVRELLFNAVKYAHVGSASVNVRQIAGAKIRITVSDNGLGFDPGALKKAGQTGGGYGLFSIRERLDMLGALMDVDSAPGQGSRFILTVPLSPVPERAAAGVPVPPAPGEQAAGEGSPRPSVRIRLLLADDHAVVRQGLRRLLGEEPDLLVIGEAAHGLEAIELAGALQPDVILMDVNIPKLNGVEATRAIHHAHPNIRIIGLSMFEDRERARSMREAGAVDYLTKSAPPCDLIAAIRRAGRPAAAVASDARSE